MRLTQHLTSLGPNWAVDGIALPPGLALSSLLSGSRQDAVEKLRRLRSEGQPLAAAPLLAPVDATQEVWASGVTYKRSRNARTDESQSQDVYQRVYDAVRPELFFKSIGRRVIGTGAAIGLRRDSKWHVPEPELTLVLTSTLEVLGYTAGNDVSCRDIEGENPLYLPQAKMFDGCCAVGAAIHIAPADALRDLAIECTIRRADREVFSGSTRSSMMNRSLEELAEHLGRCLSFEHGALLMTGTGLVPPNDFTLAAGDVVRIQVGEAVLENPVESAVRA